MQKTKEDFNARFNTAATRADISIGIVILICAVLLGGMWLDSRHRKEEQEKTRVEAETAERNALRKRITELSQRHDAIMNWRQALSNRGAWEPIYGAELSNALVNLSHRPILLIASVREVTQNLGTWNISFMGKVNFHNDLLLHLSCDDDQARAVMSKPRGQSERFAVIAIISSVESTEKEVRGASDGSSYAKAVSVATGQLVDVQYIGNYYGDYAEVDSTFRKP